MCRSIRNRPFRGLETINNIDHIANVYSTFFGDNSSSMTSLTVCVCLDDEQGRCMLIWIFPGRRVSKSNPQTYNLKAIDLMIPVKRNCFEQYCISFKLIYLTSSAMQAFSLY